MPSPTVHAQFLEPRLALDWQLSPSVQLDEADQEARSALERADQFLADGQWEEGIDTLLDVLDEAGEAVVPATGLGMLPDQVFARYVPLRDYCHGRIAALHREAPQALQRYRQRVDPLAEQWYRQGVAERDATILRRVAERFFASTWGDDALRDWGELELQRGSFTWARSAWEKIIPGVRLAPQPPGGVAALPGSPLWIALRRHADGIDAEFIQQLSSPVDASWQGLTYPDTDLDLAEIRARLTIVSILEGSAERASVESRILAALYPEAEGRLAGQSGRLADRVERLREEAAAWTTERRGDDWTTFGGSPARNQIARETVDPAMQPIWSVRLRPAENPLEILPSLADPLGSPSYHPVIADGTVLVNTDESLEGVFGMDLLTGEPVWPLPEHLAASPPRGAGRPESPSPEPARPQFGLMAPRPLGPSPLGQLGNPRFTMTVDGNRLYVKLGRQATSYPASDRTAAPPAGYLAALDLAAQKKRLFEIHLDQPPWGPDWSFEGPPVAEDGRLFTALRRRDNLRVQAHVACFDARRGDLIWRKSVAAAETLADAGLIEYTHNLLSLDQGTLYFNTNLGAVAALRAEDGAIRWLLRYPRQPDGQLDPDRSLMHLARDLNPCVVARDRVFVAPADSDRIFALDAASGCLLWTTTPPLAGDVVHLLGAAADRLIASGRQLYWLDARDGQLVGRFPSRDEASLRGCGRGILAAGAIYWPTRERIYVFDQRGLAQLRQPIDLRTRGLRGGNLVVSQGVLIIASADRLAAFNAFGVPSHGAGQ